MTNDQNARRVSFALVIAAAIICLFLPQGAWAQAGVGGRVGVSATPDQFYFGGHYDTGYIFERLSFRPNLEVGLGDNQTTVAANFEFAYWLPSGSRPYTVYVGGGPALNVYRQNLTTGSTTDAKPGLNLLAGAALRNGFFAELKLGLIDSPAIKFGVGFTWKR